MVDLLVVRDSKVMQKKAREILRSGKSIGFVPTMGALHAGHASLVERARKENDVVIVSIYVNPTQFGPNEDFSKYPRTFDADKKLCAEAGADILFAPENMYDEGTRTYITVGGLDETLCGLSRPGHFRGVATVVAKLFAVTQPDRAYFGRKDAQQLLIIESMVRDLDLPVTIIPCETVREADGLAMSSRNKYLSPADRKKALCVSRALKHFKKQVDAGERDAMTVLGEMAEILSEDPDVEIDYVSIVDAHNLEDLKRIEGDILAAIAVKIGTTRLIDNMRMENVSY